jgi:predicted solute-binding protein
MQLFRIGCVNYINALPLYLPFRLGKIAHDFEFIYDIPSALNTLLRRKAIDAALTSSVEYLDGDYHFIKGLGISGLNTIMSVNFYTQFPILALSGMRVGLTHHSATSIALLKVLCHYLWKIEPHFEPLNREEPFINYAAFLLIGDEALKHLSISNFQTIDLCHAWYMLTALPFVFAVMAVKEATDKQKIAEIGKKFETALNWSDSNREVVESEALKHSSLPPALIQKYFSVINYRLGKKEMEGLKTFNHLRKLSAHYVPEVLS